MKARVRVISYSETQYSLGPVRFIALKRLGDKDLGDQVDLGEKPEEALEKIAREHGGGIYAEAIAETRSGVIRVGVSRRNIPQGGTSKILFYRPSRLLKIGIIESIPIVSEERGEQDLSVSAKPQEEGSEEASQPFIRSSLNEDQIIWYTPGDEIYIYEGEIYFEKECELIIFLTEDGERISFATSEEERKISIKRVKKQPRKTVKRRRKKDKKGKKSR